MDWAHSAIIQGNPTQANKNNIIQNTPKPFVESLMKFLFFSNSTRFVCSRSKGDIYLPGTLQAWCCLERRSHSQSLTPGMVNRKMLANTYKYLIYFRLDMIQHVRTCERIWKSDDLRGVLFLKPTTSNRTLAQVIQTYSNIYRIYPVQVSTLLSKAHRTQRAVLSPARWQLQHV